jgi:hypothetical protein
VRKPGVGRFYFLIHSFLLAFRLRLTFLGSSNFFDGSRFKEGGLLPREDAVGKRGSVPLLPINS